MKHVSVSLLSAEEAFELLQVKCVDRPQVGLVVGRADKLVAPDVHVLHLAGDDVRVVVIAVAIRFP